MSWDFMNEEFSRERHIFIPNTYTAEDIFAHIERTMKNATIPEGDKTRKYIKGWIGKPMGPQIGIINLDFGNSECEQQIEVYIYDGIALGVEFQQVRFRRRKSHGYLWQHASPSQKIGTL